MTLTVDQDRLLSEINTLAAISDAEPPAVTRIVFTPTDLKARAWMQALCQQANLTVREDAIGNTFARWTGSAPDAPVVGTGSHIDAIPNAGKYDGVVGVLGGLEAIRTLQRAGFRPQHSIELLIFTAEEPTRFGIGCLGSRLLSGALSADAARELREQNAFKKDTEKKDLSGKEDTKKLTAETGAAPGPLSVPRPLNDEPLTMDQIRRQAGFTGELDDVKLPRGYYKAFIELHIEQGPLLERHQIPLGIVTSIAAPASLRVLIEGAGGHAGAVLMPDRRDALCAAAELILAAENAARSNGAIDSVATVGICDVFPGAVNSIPSRIRLTVDIRDTDLQRRDSMVRALETARHAIAAKRQLSIASDLVNADAPANCAPAIIEALAQSCRKHEIKFLPMVSRAYHDSLFIARVAPVAMLFIPCRHGYSHRPDEYASPEDIARGTLVLAETLATLAE